MASIYTETNGRKAIQFIAGDGKRRTIRLGAVSQRQAEAVKLRVEDLAHAAMTGTAPRRETSTWLAGLDETMRERFAAVGLAERRSKATLGAFIDDAMLSRADVKETTRTCWRRMRMHIVGYFGEDWALRSISPGDADSWRLHLLASGLAENTVRRTCGLAKQLFRVAVRRRLIDDNPFADVVAAVTGNAERSTL